MLDRIEISGYRRLKDVHAYVGRKTVAFVGPNEAGKSSILSALRLFSSDDPVPASDVTRTLRGEILSESRTIVRLFFTLSDEQRTILRSLPIEHQSLRHLTFRKVASGKRFHAFEPTPTLLPSVMEGLKRAWPTLVSVLTAAYEAIEDGAPTPFSPQDLESVSAFIQDGTGVPNGEVWDRVRAGLEEFVDEEDVKLGKKLRDFQTYYEWARPGVSLDDLVYRSVGGAFPTFVQFTDDLRSIRSEYQVNDSALDRDRALGNLLRLAQISLEEIRGAISEPDHLRTLEDQANDRLRAFFEVKWQQERITVGIRATEEFLRVDVKDLNPGSPGWIKITERSDGLRTFVALAAFLESGGFESPPILLIDEAEQHLHQNAQGDLIRMLQDLQAVQQVLYTTHSPACLPADLGNGVRFVEPVENGHSVIRHDFWSLDRNQHVGFNPLLIVMGAGAAAFSSLRSALVAEGVSDMLLLPTLIKLATGKRELDYQVTPGIATASKTDMAKLDFVASRVAYLVDGDPGGTEWHRQLLDADVPEDRIRALPKEVGLEDLLDRDFYLDAIAEVSSIDRSQLMDARSDMPVKAAIHALGLTSSLASPVAFAEFVLGRHESGEALIVLNLELKRFLVDLDKWVERVVVA